MSDLVAVEDVWNLREIMVHHLGHPWSKDDDGRPIGMVDAGTFEALELDLARYCTRLRCQPRTDEHVDDQGYRVPAHRLIGGRG